MVFKPLQLLWLELGFGPGNTEGFAPRFGLRFAYFFVTKLQICFFRRSSIVRVSQCESEPDFPVW